MADAQSFTKAALALPGAISAAHFDRIAFKAKRTFATLAADGLSANLMFTPDEQELKCTVAPDVFKRIDNGWGRKGATTMWLDKATDPEVEAALVMAHAHAVGPAQKR